MNKKFEVLAFVFVDGGVEACAGHDCLARLLSLSSMSRTLNMNALVIALSDIAEDFKNRTRCGGRSSNRSVQALDCRSAR